ncbi:Flp family type IVb pilin [Oceanisphaera sp. KMM 10153]|uniref:Flp family type IVb pilin n=1 Tax=Oceanisphaera submarina TaxID=3390193 RepID=UPI003976D162
MLFNGMLCNELKRFWHDEQGLTTVEYAVAGALVAASLVGAFLSLGDGVGASINAMCKVVKNDGTDC